MRYFLICAVAALVFGSYPAAASIRTEAGRGDTPLTGQGLGQMRTQGAAKTRHDTARNSISNVRRATHLNEAALREIESKLNDIQTRLDSLSEMGEMESLRLQRAMDRMSRMMRTLSNLLKKASETQSGITQNIK